MAITAKDWNCLFVETSSVWDREALLAELEPVFQLTDLTKISPDFKLSSLYRLSDCLKPTDHPWLLKLCHHPWAKIQRWAIEQVFKQDERPVIKTLCALFKQDWPDAVHFYLMERISTLQPPLCYRRINYVVSDLGQDRPEFEAYLIRMLSFPSISRQVQALVILADGLFTGAIDAIAKLLNDEREVRTTDWDDIPRCFSLEYLPDYPWRMKVSEIAREALIELDNSLCFERAWLEKINPIPETLQKLFRRVLTDPESYPRCQQYLNQSLETNAFVRLNYLIYLESQSGPIGLDETCWLPFLTETDLSLVWILARHLQSRQQFQAFSKCFCHQLLDAKHGLLQGLGLYLLAEACWPESQSLAQTWLNESVPEEEKETLLLGELYIEMLSSEGERQRWAIKALGLLPGEQTITTLLHYLKPHQASDYQIAAAESFIQLQAKPALPRLIQQLTESFEHLVAFKHRDQHKIWVPQLKVLERLGDAQYLPQLIPLLPIDPYLENLDYHPEVISALIQVLQSWNLDASHPLLQNLCERQLDILDELDKIGVQEACPNRPYLVDFLANICTEKQAKRLLPHLAPDSQGRRFWSQRSRHSLKSYLTRILTAEDLPEIEQLIRPQNILCEQILDGLRQAKLAGTRELIQRLLERDDWSALWRRRLQAALKSIPII